MLGFLFIAALLSTQTGHACEMLKPEKNEIYINPDIQYIHFGNKLKSAGPITSEIFKCQKETGKYLMFSIGVKRPGLFSDVAHISYDGLYNKNKCSFKNSNLENDNQKFEAQVEDQIKKQYEFVRSCMYLRVQDLGRTPIEFKPNQTACRMRAQTSGTIIMDGDYCFSKIDRNQHLQLAVEVRQNCLNPNYLKSKNFSAQDLEVVVNTWVAGDDSGVSSDLEYLRSIPIQVSILPSHKLLSKSENVNKPEIEYPNTYNVDIHQGPFAIQQVGSDRFNLDYSLEVTNQSNSICRDNLPCTSISNYNAPVAGLIELTELTRTGEEYIKSWPFLGIVPAQHQGVLKNMMTPVLDKFKFEPSKTYKISFKMLDPYEDYWIALNSIKAIKFNLPTPNETLDNVQNTPTTDVLGDYKGLPMLPSSMVRNAIAGSIEELNRLLRSGGERNMWPPRYEKICSNNSGICRSIEHIPEVVSLDVKFQVGRLNSDSGAITFKSVQKSKSSFGQSAFVQNSKKFPEYNCGPQ